MFTTDHNITDKNKVLPLRTLLLYRPTDTLQFTTLAIIAVFLEYLGQFLIDFNQTYRRSSVPKNTSPWIFSPS